MKQQITLQQYRNIDLTILSVVLAIGQVLIHLASSKWFPDQLYIVTPVAAMTALVMMRWSAWAWIPALLGGGLFTILSDGQWYHFAIYCLGNLAALAALPVLKRAGKETVRNSAVWSVLFGLSVQLLMWTGRAAVGLALGHGWQTCLRFITTDILSGLFTVLIIWIVRRIDGLFEDQKHYLLRIQSENQVEGREQF